MINLQKIWNNRLFFKKIIVFIFLFFLPTQLGKHFFLDFSYIKGVRIDYLAPTLYFTDCLFILLFFIFKKNIFKRLRQQFKLILFFLSLFFINIFFSRHFFLAFYRFLKIFEFYILFLIFKDFKDKKVIFFSFFLGGIFQLILVILQLIFQRSLQGIFYFFGERYFSLASFEIAKISFEGREIIRPYGTFSHPNSLAGFYLLLYFLFLTFFKASFLRSLILTIFSLLIFFSFSKIAILTFLILNVFYLFKNFSFKNCWLCFFSRFFTLFFLSLGFLSFKGDPFSLQKRIVLLKDSIKIFLSSPIFGVGLNHYLFAQSVFPQKYPYFFLQPVHNIFLLGLVEMGLILTGSLLIKIWPYLKASFKKQTFIFCFLVILLTGMFDHYWLTLQQNLLLAGVILGIIL